MQVSCPLCSVLRYMACYSLELSPLVLWLRHLSIRHHCTCTTLARRMCCLACPVRQGMLVLVMVPALSCVVFIMTWFIIRSTAHRLKPSTAACGMPKVSSRSPCAWPSRYALNVSSSTYSALNLGLCIRAMRLALVHHSAQGAQANGIRRRAVIVHSTHRLLSGHSSKRHQCGFNQRCIAPLDCSVLDEAL